MAETIRVTRPRQMPPVHPGTILRDDVLPALNISVSAAARELGLSRQTLHRILAGQLGEDFHVNGYVNKNLIRVEIIKLPLPIITA